MKTHRNVEKAARRMLEKEERQKFKYTMRDLIEQMRISNYITALIAILLLLFLFLFAYR